jgi:dTDP-4-dehydrorhamnose reductase
MKILLLGSKGQLGKELERQLSSVGSVTAFPKDSLNITNHKAVQSAVQHVHPDIIVNAAAYTAVDKAETDAETAHAVNAHAVANLAEIAKRERLWLIHYSTDYVFDGSKKLLYIEKDEPNPINTYGASKLEGERAIRKVGCQHLIFRTTWIIGKDGHNFAKTIMRQATRQNELFVINDQIGVPTSPSLISRVTIDAIRAVKRGKAWPQGVYHLAPRGVSSWYEIAKVLVSYAEQQHIPLRVNTSDISGITSADYSTQRSSTAAKRPLNSQMDTNKLRSQLSFELPHWKDDFLAVVIDIARELKAT